MGPRVFVTAVGRFSAPLDGSGLAPDLNLGGRLSARLDISARPGEPRLHALARLAGEAALRGAPALGRLAPEDKGVFLSSSKGGMECFDRALPDLGEGLWRYLSSSPGRALRDDLGWHGGGRNTPLACATGAYAIGLALEDLRAGRIQAALAGAAEASLTPLIAAAFEQSGALAKARQVGDLRGPFDSERSGFVLGEGAAALVLESEAALARTGHVPLAELRSWACTCDAWHLTAPRPDGSQAARCLRLALYEAGLEPSDVVYVSAHGTGTVAGDLAEARALHAVFGSGASGLGPRVSSIKGATGHTLGASGALCAAVTVEALASNRLPGTAACRKPMPEMAPWLALEPEALRPGAAVSLSMGFGGHNVALVFGLA
ncbi:MAG: beta-ketoacyl synthase N-terminal-like domain-containing protein [bacterium]